MQVETPSQRAVLGESGQWPSHRTSILDWLMIETRNERFIDNIFVDLCQRLREAGVPVARATLNFRIQHPLFQGASMLWRKGMTTAEMQTFEHGALDTAAYTNSPIKAIQSGMASIRQRLDPKAALEHAFPIFEELREEGLTDYLAWPIEHTLQRRHVATFATDRQGGFTKGDIAFIADLLPALALVSEIRLKNRFARTLLETYVGPHASAEILAGAITRGSGTTVSAAILICDLRDFTTISELWPRDDVIEILNGYFDAMSDPIEAHGGEILKFMGDGLLAIFPLDQPMACDKLLQAVAQAQTAVAAFNETLRQKGRPLLRYGIGIHVGDVMYGNIGSKRRLDFTVIGPVVNTASRLESLTKELKRPVLLSRAFADMAGCQAALESLGSFPLRGLGESIEVLAFTGDVCRASLEP
ncbi:MULTISPECIES: adenylate/guanylate cyclase domain-containing protein [unclassified Aureimonas]|uniref:adenylate/guanylate cyclase domain-containing protein n=1 Tax=unclassified Aureimonas TaxID=2615206 RepID=UPI0006F75A80|nr:MULTISPECIES: adenylate/guanylate cyclase domain-containing protein [unclassified Aureimonas]KQT52416.1 adenylate cyclase [Aureimonas sp. Leaf427]KQT74943.1 adenylate cyclase [Aureimonas sp. Leaf460]